MDGLVNGCNHRLGNVGTPYYGLKPNDNAGFGYQSTLITTKRKIYKLSGPGERSGKLS